MLASVNKKKISSYSVRVLQALAQTVGKSEGEVLEELLLLEQENPNFVAHNAEELLLAFKNKETYIIIRGDFKKEIDEVAKGVLNDSERMGVELGSGGGLTILAEIFFQIGKFFSNKDPELKKIESEIRFYKFKRINDDELLLYLRQLDY